MKDHRSRFEGLRNAGVDPVPNTVSRDVGVGDKALQGWVAESGKPVLDVDIGISQNSAREESRLVRRWHAPSGWFRGNTHRDAYCDWVLGQAPVGLVDDSVSGGHLHGNGTLLDAVILPRLEAFVAGHPVVVEFTGTRTDGYNLVALNAARIYDGTNASIKRTDFVFLEVFEALVAPSPRASGTVRVVTVGSVAPGDLVSINGIALTAVAAGAAVNTFVIGGTAAITATNIATALNAVANAFDLIVVAKASLDLVTISAATPGAGTIGAQTGNFVTLSVTTAVPGAMVASGATLTGGSNRPHKPFTDQAKLYRHGNVLSPSPTWLDDEMTDPTLAVESSQRVQLQYRIRTTGTSEGVNHKSHPDGFSTLVAGGGPNEPAVFAQGGRDQPVWAGNGTDVNSYPFVRADGTSVWLQSSAVSYGAEDDGLWVAGNGNATSAQDLGSLNGYVYAIPIGFVFRHNDVSAPAAAVKGFDPKNNANGAPTYGHAGYVGASGTIPAGKSDRPDGEFCNVVTTNGILDLRRHVVFPGACTSSELTYQIQSLMDGSLRTWAMDTASKQYLGDSSGDVSTRNLVCNEIGRSNTVGGDGITAGTLKRGPLVRNFDHVARRFADQPVVERVVFAFWPGDRPAVVQGGAVAPGLVNPGKYIVKIEDPANPGTPKNPDQWYEGDVLHLDLEFLNVTTLGGLFDARPGAGSGGGGSGVGLPSQMFLTFAPVGTVITDVLSAYHDDGNYGVIQNQTVQMGIVKGLGTTHLEFALDANDTAMTGGRNVASYRCVGRDQGVALDTQGSERRIFVEVEITYPPGVGTTDTPVHLLTPDAVCYDGTGKGPGPVVENTVAQRPNDFEALPAPSFRTGFREVLSEYVANDTIGHTVGDLRTGLPVGDVSPESLVSRNRTQVVFPRRIHGVTGLLVKDAVAVVVKTVDPALSDFGSSSRLVTVTAQLSGVGQTLCDVEYFARDPIPNYGVQGGGWQLAYYFRTNAPQTAGTKEGDVTTAGGGVVPTTLTVEPLVASSQVWSGQRGMGGHELAFPYASPLDQIPINDGQPLAGPDQIGGTTEEWFFSATAEMTVADFDADTGLLALHAFVQQDVQGPVVFGGAGVDEKPRKDAEFRTYYPFADDETYRPVIIAQPLSGAVRHKAFVPFLARVTETVPGTSGGILFRKSELVLVVLTKFVSLGTDNTIGFVDPSADNRTSAAVYRTRNLLLVVGDRTPCPGS